MFSWNKKSFNNFIIFLAFFFLKFECNTFDIKIGFILFVVYFQEKKVWFNFNVFYLKKKKSC